MSNHRTIDRGRRGTALGAAMVLSLVVAIILTSLIRWSTNEQNHTMRHVALAKTRMVAESVDQYGAAQIKARLDQLTYFADDEFRPGNNPPILPNVSTIVHDLLNSGITGGIGHTLSGLLGNAGGHGNGNGNSGSSSSNPDSTAGYFRYEVTPETLVVGRFSPARWERAESSNPLYVGDPLIDQTIRVREVQMVSSARADHPGRSRSLRAYCESYLQVRDSPVWGNALFYNMDLEIAPGAAMDLYGPVHTNRDLYIQTDATLRFHDLLTSAGRLYHGRSYTSSAAGGTVTIRKAGTSDHVSLSQNGAWVDGRVSDWAAQASVLWAGNVRTKEHGINPAIPAGIAPYVPEDPATSATEFRNPARVLIENAVQNNNSAYPGDVIEVQKYATKACLVFDVTSLGLVSLYKYETSNSGKYIRDNGLGAGRYSRKQLTIPTGLVVGSAASDKFYDKRRGKWIKSLDLDVGKLKTLIESPGAAAAFTFLGNSFDPATEWNGVVYVGHANSSSGAVRLVNGQSIPSRPTSHNGNSPGFTLATDAPLYVQGNYNADGSIASDGALIRNPDSSSEPPAGLAADAITILSNGWSDANSSLDLDNRIAQQTEIAAAIMTGIVPTNKNGNGAYSGGVENLPRLLENWSGIKLGYRGSMVVLYESERATEPWGSSSVYNPPNRVWGFNALFAGGALPPGTPSSRSYRRIGFRDLTATQYQEALAAIGDE